VIIYTQQDFEAEVKRLTGGKGVDVVYDSVGKDTFDKGLNLLRPRGYMVLFGQASGAVGPLDPQVLNAKGSIFLTRPSLGHYLLDRAELVYSTGPNWSTAPMMCSAGRPPARSKCGLTGASRWPTRQKRIGH